MASVSCETRVGIASAASSVAWAGGGSRRKFVDWLPKLSEPIGVVRGDNVYLNEQMWNFLREMSDRFGGVNGPTLPQIQTTANAIQTQVAVTTNYAVQVADYASQVAATATATAQVAENNSLSGSGSIPPTGSPPNRPNINYQVE